jgi:DNA modification methylase
MEEKKLTSKHIYKSAQSWLLENLKEIFDELDYGLAEWDDRQNMWRITLLSKKNKKSNLGELSFDKLGNLITEKSTTIKLIKQRLKNSNDTQLDLINKKSSKKIIIPSVPNKLILGDAIEVLEDFPQDSVQLVVTSPPYYNARQEYAEYLDYQEYLDFLRKVFARAHAVLSEGRFCVVNISPVLLKRANRNESSKRIPIPFDLHKIMEGIGFEFIDDIHWVKPEGAGWAAGRGRRFSADRQPLQYKPVVVTEYILVYRKKSDKLIDWNIKNHPDQDAVRNSLITGDYDVTNIWKISPSRSKHHPATYPEELVKKIIRYYSFEGDMVLDPFAGSGTTGKVALDMNRRMMMIEKDKQYFNYMKQEFSERFLKINDKIRIDIDENNYNKGCDNE